MVRRALTKKAKEAVKKGIKKGTTTKGKSGRVAKPKVRTASPLTRTPSAQKRTAQRKARADRSAKPKSAPTPLTRTPSAQKRRSQRAARTASGTAAATAARTSSTTAARQGSRGSKIPTGVKVAAVAAPAAGLATMYTRKGKPKPTDMTFGEAFKQARAKGEGTKFTYKGKQFSAVTKDDLKKKGYKSDELKQYLNRKGKRKGLLSRILKPRSKPIKRSGKPGSMKMAKLKAGGMATRGLGKAYMNSKR